MNDNANDLYGWSETQNNTIWHGIITKVTQFGVFVEVSSESIKFEGLLHRSKIPTGESYSEGDSIEVVATHRNRNGNIRLDLACN